MRKCSINRLMFYVRLIGLCTHVISRDESTREYPWGQGVNVDYTYVCLMYCI